MVFDKSLGDNIPIQDDTQIILADLISVTMFVYALLQQIIDK